MENKTIREKLGDILGKYETSMILAAIHAWLKEKITELRKPTFVCECDGDKKDHCSCGARDREVEARKIDQVLKILEQELTDEK